MSLTRAYVRIIQRKLADLGHYNGSIDGVRGPKTHAAVAVGFADLGQGMPDGFAGWSGKRQSIAFLQAQAEAEGIETGGIDGLWGPGTSDAAFMLQEKLTTGQITNFHDMGPQSLSNPNGFPIESRSQAEITAFFGAPGTNWGSGRPPLEKVPLPWTMKLAWDRSAKRSFLWANPKCAASLARVLARVDAAYTQAQKEDLGIDLLSGDYNPRRMSGANRPSLHAWGIAYDFDDERNGLRANASQARLGQRDAIPFWEAWEAEGWCPLGRARNYDFMHVQAAARAY